MELLGFLNFQLFVKVADWNSFCLDLEQRIAIGVSRAF